MAAVSICPPGVQDEQSDRSWGGPGVVFNNDHVRGDWKREENEGEKRRRKRKEEEETTPPGASRNLRDNLRDNLHCHRPRHASLTSNAGSCSANYDTAPQERSRGPNRGQKPGRTTLLGTGGEARHEACRTSQRPRLD